MSELTAVVLDEAQRLGPGHARHTVFMAALKRMKEFKLLPDWRKAYLQGYAEGAAAILSMDAAGILPAPKQKKARPSAPPPPAPEPEIEAPEAELEFEPAYLKPAAKPRVRTRLVTSTMPEEVPVPPAPDADDAKHVAWFMRMLKAAAAMESQGLPSPEPNGHGAGAAGRAR